MSLHQEIIKNITGFSLAKYSTWFYYKPDHLLFDAGEGVSVMMRNMIYGIEYIFISHGHGDHTAGIPGILRSRASSMGDKEKPITIYYPKADRNINKIYQYVKDSIGNLPFEVVWEELCDGDIVSLPSKRQIQAFKVQHKEPTLTLGYKIEETRTKLKDEYKNLSTKELLQEIQKYGKSHISRSYLHPLLCYSGDTMALPEEIMQDAEVVLHDCTFLNSEDRDENTHATIDEVFANVQKSNIKLLGLFHFSTRYKYQEIVNSIQEHIKKYNVTFPVYYIYSYINGINFKQCL